jgi:hypothetical protein
MHNFPALQGQISYAVNKSSLHNTKRKTSEINHPHVTAGTDQLTSEGHTVEHMSGYQQGFT